MTYFGELGELKFTQKIGISRDQWKSDELIDDEFDKFFCIYAVMGTVCNLWYLIGVSRKINPTAAIWISKIWYLVFVSKAKLVLYVEWIHTYELPII